ncbi:MAG: hypothetical protein AAB590_00005, partial [Patescibacteria group bacterium]
MRRTIYVLVAVGIIAGGYLVLLFTKSEPSTESVVATTGQSKQIAEKDTDRDGLADWEELLWGTSITNPDSDGDGVSDKEEAQVIESQRLAQEKKESIVTPYAYAYDPKMGETLTERLALNLGSNYLSE